MPMFTKPRGIHATFAVDCPRCDGEFTVTNGRVDFHECESPLIAALRKSLE